MTRWHRLFASMNLLITVLLLGMLFIMVNYLSSRRYTRIDLTKTKIATLSDKTRQVLTQLKNPVTIIVFYQPQRPKEEGGSPEPLYPLITDLLQEYERFTNKLTIERVDPYRDRARAEQLVKQLSIDRLNLVIFQSGLPAAPQRDKDGTAQAGARHKYLSDTDLADFDYSSMANSGAPTMKAFKGEEAFTSAILSVTQNAQPLVWLTTGHGEKSLTSKAPDGLAELKQSFEQANMRLEEVTLLERPTIPSDVQLVVIAGPVRRFTETELLSLESYLEGGGRLLALIDPLDNTGLDGLLEHWGIQLGMDIVVDPARQLPFVSGGNLFVTDYTRHPIVQKMQTLMTLYPLARSVRLVQPTPAGLTATPLAMTSRSGWGEHDTAVETFEYNEGKDLKGPVSIAVAVERTQPARTRIVAFGDSDFAANAQLGNVGNRDMALGAVYWLTEQERLIGIGPKTLQSTKLNLTSRQLTRVLWFSLFAMPLLCGMLGTGMWWVRRK